MENSDTALRRENCKFALWILFVLIFVIGLGLGIKFGLLYLANCCVTSTGALVVTCIGIGIGIILLAISLFKCVQGDCECLYKTDDSENFPNFH